MAQKLAEGTIEAQETANEIANKEHTMRQEIKEIETANELAQTKHNELLEKIVALEKENKELRADFSEINKGVLIGDEATMRLVRKWQTD